MLYLKSIFFAVSNLLFYKLFIFLSLTIDIYCSIIIGIVVEQKLHFIT